MPYLFASDQKQHAMYPFQSFLVLTVTGLLGIAVGIVPVSGQGVKAGLGESGNVGRPYAAQREDQRAPLFLEERMNRINALPLPGSAESPASGPWMYASYLTGQPGAVFTAAAFDVVLLQALSFGKIRIGPGGGELVVQPSGAVASGGDIVSLGGMPLPAIFEITTDSLRWLEVLLPGALHLEAPGAPHLIAKPLTDQGRQHFIVELKPRPHQNRLRIGGALQLLPGREAVASDFSGSMEILFRPLAHPFPTGISPR